MSVHAQKVVGSFGWVALSRYVNRFLGFITTLILAKLLAPEDFGLVAIAAMTIDILKLFKDMGLGQALIHRREEVAEASHTAFFLLIGVNTLLFLGAVALSPLAADFYANDAVMPVLIVMSSNLVWFAFRAVPDALVRKNVDFQKLVVPEIVPVVIGVVVAIWMAYRGFGVWSLVTKALIVDILGTVLIWRYTDYRPAFRFDMRVARELLGYGKYVVGNTVMLVVLYSVDRFYISKFGSLALLGIYTLAFTIANLPTTELGHVVCRVMFPVFTKLNQDTARLRAAFLKTVRYASLFVLPVVLGIAVYGPAFVDVFFGEKWKGMAVPMQLLCFYAMFRALSAIMHELFKAVGLPQLAQRFTVSRLIVIAALGIPAVTFFGLPGVSLLLVLTYGVMFVWEAFVACRLVQLPVVEFFRSLWRPAVGSAGIVLGVYGLIWALGGAISSTMTMIVGASFSIVLYALFMAFVDKTALIEIRQMLGSRKAVA